MLLRSLSTLSFVLILFGELVAQSSQFIEAPQYTVGPSPLAAAAGDLNGDGKLDLVVTNKVDGTVSVLMNKGNGTFKSQVSYDVGGVPASLAIADVNGDGHLDVVVTLPVESSLPGSHISALLGNGDGTLQAYVHYDTGLSPQFVAVQDLNGDGTPDIVVANAGVGGTPGSSVSVLINDGMGRFPTHVEYRTGIAPLSVAIGDFNGDHKPDLAVANSCGSDPTCSVSSAGTVSILLGNGNGTFQNQRTFAVGYKPDVIAASDFNGDGRLDLAVGNFNDNNVGILMGQGDGTFQPQVTYLTAPWEPNGIVVADFNHDGNIDLAVGNAGSSSISILLGNGDGTFQERRDYWAGNGAGMLAAGDFNGDSRIDLAVPDLGWSDRPDNKVSILLGNGDGTFQSHVFYGTGVTPGALVSGDFNRDGTPDLVVGEDPTTPETADGGWAKISVLLGNGDGTYQSSVDYPTGRFPASVAVGDFNRDGNLDIAVANYGSSATPGNTVSVLLGNGDGTFQPQVTYNVGNNPLAIAVTDVNHDGKLDLVVSNTGDTTPNVGVLLGNGDGTFQSQLTSALGGSATALAAADLNRDGLADIVVLLPSLNKVATLLGNGDGTFKAPQEFATGTNPVSVAVGDFNVDGSLDVAVVNQSDATMGVLLGNGDGTLRSQVTYPTPNLPSSVVEGDFNGDSMLDLLVSSRSDNTVSLFLGKGDGTFPTPPAAYGTGWQPIALAVADVNRDGTLDVVSANSAVRSVSVILNAQGTFVTIESSAANSSYGEPITLTGAVAASVSWRPTPSGTVKFFDGNKLLGTGKLSGGTVSLTISSLTAGSHILSAAYSGDANFQPHTSSPITQVVNGQDFSMAASPFSGPMHAGESGTSTVTITFAHGFSGAVALACSVTPNPLRAPICSLNPSLVNASNGATSTLTVSTTAPQFASILHRETRRNSEPVYALWVSIASLTCVVIGFVSNLSPKHMLVGLLLSCLLLVGLLFQLGCAGSSTSIKGGEGGTPGTPAGTYTITVDGTSGSGASAITHQATITITVQ